MRPISLLTALLVMASLYLFVMERDLLRDLAGLAPAGPADAAQAPKTDAASGDTPATAEGDEKPVAVVAVKSAAQQMQRQVTLRGETRAERSVDVRAETDGRIISPPIDKGTTVADGDVLCELDPGTRPAALADARARLAAAKATLPRARAQRAQAQAALEEARIDQRAAEELAKQGFASEKRVATARAAVATAQAQLQSAETAIEEGKSAIESARADIARAETQLERTTIRAPFAGVLESTTAELGSLMQPGQSCATVLQLDPIRLVGFVPEAEVDRVSLGAGATARLVTGAGLEGKVSFVSRSADPETRTFRVEVRVANPEGRIREGQTVEVAIDAGRVPAHLVPSSALTLDDQGRLGVRLVSDDNRARFAPVRVVRDTPEGVWLAGLPETARVITIGQQFVTDGASVAPSYREAGQ